MVVEVRAAENRLIAGDATRLMLVSALAPERQARLYARMMKYKC